MDNLLLKIANALTVNITNTEEFGLFSGKTGLAVFFYEYARFSGCEYYQWLADCLIDDIYKFHQKNNLDLCAVNGYSSIGIGLCNMLHKEYLSADTNNIFYDIDDLVLSNPEKTLSQDLHYRTGLFSAGLYLMARLKITQVDYMRKYISKVMDVVYKYVYGLSNNMNDYNDKNTLRSIFLMLSSLCRTCCTDDNLLQKINFILQKIKFLCGTEYYVQRAELNTSYYSLASISDEIWWYYVHSEKIHMLNKNYIESQINRYFSEFCYYINMINGWLSSIGLTLILNRL